MKPAHLTRAEYLKRMLTNRHIYFRHTGVNNTGTTRYGDIYVVDDNFAIIKLNFDISKMLNMKIDKYERLIIKGCGVDVYFALVTRLYSVLFPEDKQHNISQIYSHI